MQSTLSTRKRTSERRNSRTRSHEEKIAENKLLGLQQNDEGAVPIRKPQSSFEGKMPSLSYGGPRPRNTLDQPNGLPNIRNSRNSAINHSSGKIGALQTSTVRGDNVRRHNTIVDSGFNSLPRAKRRKIDYDSDDVSPTSDVSVVDPMKDHLPEDLIITTGSSSMSRTPSGSSQPPLPRQNMDGNFAVVREFRNVERTMNSNHKQKKPRSVRNDKRHSSASHPSSSSPPISGMQINSDPMDLLEDEDMLQEAEPRASINRMGPISATTPRHGHQRNYAKTNIQADSSEFSKYFSKNNCAPSSKHQRPEKPQLYNETPVKVVRLGRQFVAEDGKWRGSHNIASSPDELTSGTTVGNPTNHNLASPIKYPHKDSSPAFMAASETKKSVEGQTKSQSSDLLPTKFAPKPSEKHKSAGGEAPEPFAVQLESVNIPALQHCKPLGFRKDSKTNTYTVIYNGSPLKHSGFTCQVNRSKIQKVLHEIDGKKFRFQSSQVENERNILEIELSHVKDAEELIHDLKDDGPLQFIGKSSEDIGKIFQNSYSTLQSHEKRHHERPKPVNSVEEQMTKAEAKRQNLERRKRGEPRSLSPARPRIVDQMKPKPVSETAPAPAHQSAVEALDESQKSGGSNIDNILTRLKLKSKTDWWTDQQTLRKSTRSTRNTDKVHALDDVAAEVSEPPEPLKFSKVQGLGQKWRKPLIYPKIGKKKATVDFQDLERLDEGEFLNDTLVTFYMRYLEHEMEDQHPELAKRIYFFSTFFYERLTDFAKGKREINYPAVEKWTTKVDIFTYDYVVIPVNESYHWYVAIICNLPALDRNVALHEDNPTTNCKDEPILSSPNAPEALDEPETVGDAPVHDDEGIAARGTRESFAELSLESDDPPNLKEDDNVLKYEKTAVGDAAPKPEDEMLFDEPAITKHRHATSDHHEVSIAKSNAEPAVTPGNVADEKLKTLTPTKKQKRKSLAPITQIDPKRPLIITFDSFGTPHSRPIGYLKDYLVKECKAKRGMEIDTGTIKGITAKGIPEQNNFSDCGVYMLGYLHKFMKDGPQDFIAKTVKREYVKEDWSGLVPSEMRISFRNLLLDLGKAQDEELRTAKAERRRSEDKGESKAQAPARRPNKQSDHAPSSSKPASSRPSPVPPEPSRKEALESAKSLDDAFEDDKGKQEPENAIDSQQPVTTNNIVASTGVLVEQISQDEPSLVLLESRPHTEDQLEIPSSQPTVPGSFPQEHAGAHDLPSQIDDSQDPLQEETEPPQTRIPRTPSPEKRVLSRIEGAHYSTPQSVVVKAMQKASPQEPKRQKKRRMQSPTEDQNMRPAKSAAKGTVISIDD